MGSSCGYGPAGYGAVEAKYDIQYKRFGHEKPAGSGATGEVRPCTNLKTHALCAVKTIDKTNWSTRRHVMDEIEMLQAVSGKHPHIINFLEYYEEWGTMNLIFEYCPGGTLEGAIEQETLAAAGEAGAAALGCQLLDALAYLRERDILHRDVKPANVLLVDRWTLNLKLADFGVACYCGEDRLTACEGTPAFFPPEMLQLPRGKGYSFPMDAWAAGVTLYMILFKGEHPFMERGRVSKDLLRRGDFEVGWLTSSDAKDLLEWLLMPNPEQRIVPDDALDHPWFARHSLGEGGFSKKKPSKLVLDGHGNWRIER